MATKAAIWIDHRKAAVVLIDEMRQESHEMFCDPTPGSKFDNAARETNFVARRQIVPEDRLARKAVSHFHLFCDKVIACLNQVEEFVLLGPGEAKSEFVKRLAHRRFPGRLMHMGAADKMTHRELAIYSRKLLGLRSLPSRAMHPNVR